MELSRVAERAATFKLETSGKLIEDIKEFKTKFDEFANEKRILVGSPLDLIRNDPLPFDFNQQATIADLNTSSFFPVQTNTIVNNPYANHSFAVGMNTSMAGGDPGHVLTQIQPSLNFVRISIFKRKFRILMINWLLWSERF